MKVSIVRQDELGNAELRRWEELQDSNGLLASPYFSHQYSAAVAGVLPHLRVAVLEQDNRIVGFFPHQSRWGAGEPAGGRFSDHHGVVAAPDTRWDWVDLLRQSKLSYWRFHHLASWQRPPVGVDSGISPGLDLSAGFEAYRARRLATGARRITDLPRKARKLGREIGPLRFVADEKDPGVLQTVLQLKSEQCQRTGASDCFALPWARNLVSRIADTQDSGFAGRLSALYAGETLVAAHFGMRSSKVWHWWFPVYSHAHAAYSPGAVLLMEVARAAAGEGCVLLDLGKGDEPYKASFADCGSTVLEGIVSRPTLLTFARTLRKSAGARLRSSPLAASLRSVLARPGG